MFLCKVSVRRNVPQITADLLQDEPEDWALAFPEVSLAASIVTSGSRSPVDNYSSNILKACIEESASKKGRE